MIPSSMRGGLAWLIVALVGCRLGFDERPRPPGDGAPGDDGALPAATDVELIVVSDEYGSDVRGTPIPGATVLVDRGAGLERSVTDAAGVARFAAAGVLAAHVAVNGELGWRIYTLVAPRPGTIELGGRPAVNLGGSTTFELPDSGAATYSLRVFAHCATPPLSTAPTLSISYDLACEGRVLPVIAFAFPPKNGAPEFLAPGSVGFSSGGTIRISGTFQPMPAHTVAFTDLPGDVRSASATLLRRDGLDLLPLTPTIDSAPAIAGAATVQTHAATGGDTLSSQIENDQPVAYLSTSQTIAPIAIARDMRVDARTLLSPFQSLVLTSAPDLSWTSRETRGSVLVVETITGNVQWNAYLAPSATSVAFPALPADLGIPTPTRFDVASVARIDVPGAPLADLLRTIDRTWALWPHDASLFPAAGSSVARILYAAGLGPP